MNTEFNVWYLLVLGCLPWSVSRRITHSRRRRTRIVRWQVRALFWRLTLERRGRTVVAVRFTAPVVERVQAAVWAALRQVVR